MANKEITVWGIHAGNEGQASSLFIKKNVIAIGWKAMGNLVEIKADRDAFKLQVADKYPATKHGAIPVHAGVLYRFVYEMQIGDLVVFPSKHDRLIYIGKIEGKYEYSPNLDSDYCNTRTVKWGKPLLRTAFTQGALYEIGSAVTLFLVKTYAHEFISAFEGKTKVDIKEEDETVPYVVADIEQNTRDFIIKRLAQQLKGHPFAHFVAHLLEQMGYETRISPEGPDRGIDIIAHKDELGFEPPIIKVQVKSVEVGSIGDPEVSALYGKIGAGEFGLFVTLGPFTRQALNFASSKSNLRLIDGDELVDLVLEHYEEFDSRYKGLLPLQKVYIPEALEDKTGSLGE
jgi:restriction system protein